MATIRPGHWTSCFRWRECSSRCSYYLIASRASNDLCPTLCLPSAWLGLDGLPLIVRGASKSSAAATR